MAGRLQNHPPPNDGAKTAVSRSNANTMLMLAEKFPLFGELYLPLNSTQQKQIAMAVAFAAKNEIGVNQQPIFERIETIEQIARGLNWQINIIKPMSVSLGIAPAASQTGTRGFVSFIAEKRGEELTVTVETVEDKNHTVYFQTVTSAELLQYEQAVNNLVFDDEHTLREMDEMFHDPENLEREFKMPADGLQKEANKALRAKLPMMVAKSLLSIKVEVKHILNCSSCHVRLLRGEPITNLVKKMNWLSKQGLRCHRTAFDASNAEPYNIALKTHTSVQPWKLGTVASPDSDVRFKKIRWKHYDFRFLIPGYVPPPPRPKRPRGDRRRAPNEDSSDEYSSGDDEPAGRRDADRNGADIAGPGPRFQGYLAPLSPVAQPTARGRAAPVASDTSGNGVDADIGPNPSVGGSYSPAPVQGSAAVFQPPPHAAILASTRAGAPPAVRGRARTVSVRDTSRHGVDAAGPAQPFQGYLAPLSPVAQPTARGRAAPVASDTSGNGVDADIGPNPSVGGSAPPPPPLPARAVSVSPPPPPNAPLPAPTNAVASPTTHGGARTVAAHDTSSNGVDATSSSTPAPRAVSPSAGEESEEEDDNGEEEQEAQQPGYVDDDELEVAEGEGSPRGREPVVKEIVDENGDDELAVVAEVENAIGTLSYNVAAGREKKFKCKKCSMSFYTKHSLDAHDKGHKQDAGAQFCEATYGLPIITKAAWLCRNCCVAFENQHKYQSHMVMHGDTSHNCAHCSGITFNLENHVIGHQEKKVQYACGSCLLRFSSDLALHDHLYLAHDKSLFYFCKICGLGSTNADMVYQHVVVHSGHPYTIAQRFGACPAQLLNYDPTDEKDFRAKVLQKAITLYTPSDCSHRSLLLQSDTLVSCKTCHCTQALSNYLAFNKHTEETGFPNFKVIDTPTDERREFALLTHLNDENAQNMVRFGI